MFKRGLIATVLALVVGVLLSACGSSSSAGTGADPAAIVPASSAMYLELNVPNGDKLATYQQIVTKFAGAQAWTKLSQGFTRSLKQDGLNYKSDVAPWIGSRVGVAFTSVSALSQDESTDQADGIVIILPTSDMSAAESFARKSESGGGSDGFSYAPDGKYLLIGTKSTLASFKSGAGPKLTSQPGYQSTVSDAGSDDAVFYGNVHTLATQVITLASTQSGSFGSGVNPTATLNELKTYLAKIPSDATVGLGLGSSAKAITLDVIPHDLSSTDAGATGSAGDVGDLPAGAVAALALNLSISNPDAYVNQITSAFDQVEGVSALGGAEMAQAERQITKVLTQVLPAFGPLEFAFSGTSILNLKAGLEMTPSSQGAADKLLSLLYSAIKSSASPDIQLSGNAQNFSLAAGPYNVKVGDTTGKILALVGYPSASAFEQASPALSSNATYKQAVSQLPSGAKVPFYLSFSGITTLVDGLGDATPRAKKILGAMSYLILGTGKGDERMVLGLN